MNYSKEVADFMLKSLGGTLETIKQWLSLHEEAISATSESVSILAKATNRPVITKNIPAALVPQIQEYIKNHNMDILVFSTTDKNGHVTGYGISVADVREEDENLIDPKLFKKGIEAKKFFEKDLQKFVEDRTFCSAGKDATLVSIKYDNLSPIFQDELNEKLEKLGAYNIQLHGNEPYVFGLKSNEDAIKQTILSMVARQKDISSAIVDDVIKDLESKNIKHGVVPLASNRIGIQVKEEDLDALTEVLLKHSRNNKSMDVALYPKFKKLAELEGVKFTQESSVNEGKIKICYLSEDEQQVSNIINQARTGFSYTKEHFETFYKDEEVTSFTIDTDKLDIPPEDLMNNLEDKLNVDRHIEIFDNQVIVTVPKCAKNEAASNLEAITSKLTGESKDVFKHFFRIDAIQQKECLERFENFKSGQFMVTSMDNPNEYIVVDEKSIKFCLVTDMDGKLTSSVLTEIDKNSDNITGKYAAMLYTLGTPFVIEQESFDLEKFQNKSFEEYEKHNNKNLLINKKEFEICYEKTQPVYDRDEIYKIIKTEDKVQRASVQSEIEMAKKEIEKETQSIKKDVHSKDSRNENAFSRELT